MSNHQLPLLYEVFKCHPNAPLALLLMLPIPHLAYQKLHHPM